MGRQVTISSKSTSDSRSTRDDRRNTSIHTEVSTRTTPSLTVGRPVFAHDTEVPFPGAAAGKVENLPRTRALDELLHGAFHRTRVRTFSAGAQRVLQQLCVQHKICTFHVYKVPQHGKRVKPWPGARFCDRDYEIAPAHGCAA